jgi:hypothetical protein
MQEPTRVWARDFDGDGHVDLLVDLLHDCKAGRAAVLHGHGGGTFDEPAILSPDAFGGTSVHPLVVGNFGDSPNDMLLPSDSGSTLAVLAPFIGVNPVIIHDRLDTTYLVWTPGDLNGDGVDDIVYWDSCRSEPGQRRGTVLMPEP